jgi:5'(3')-deoxyribonucleotidase
LAATLEWMQRIAIDMDEVMADTIQYCLDLYNKQFDRAVTVDHLHGRNLLSAIETAHRQHVRSYFESEEFFANIHVMEGSQDTVRDLMTTYDVFVVSAAMDVPRSFSAKFEWLRQHFPFIPTSHIVFCGDKSIVAADYLIDDNVRNLATFGGEGIIFTSHHNIEETRFRRVNNWDDVRAMFLT